MEVLKRSRVKGTDAMMKKKEEDAGKTSVTMKQKRETGARKKRL